jgi:hypothetical protein
MKESIEDVKMFQDSVNVTRDVVLKLFKKFRPKGYTGQKKLVSDLLEYYDNVTKHMKESGLEPTDTAKELRRDLTAVLFALVAEYFKVLETEIMTATKIAGLLVEFGFKSFGIECKFWIKPIEHESDNLGQSLN